MMRWFAGETGEVRLAVLMMVVGAAGFSLNGLFVRNLEDSSPWDLLFWRGLGVVVAQLILLGCLYRRAVLAEFRKMGGWGVIAAIVNGCSPIGFFLALEHTSVANALFIMCAVPLFTAVLARVVLGERIMRRTMIAIPIAATGIAIMVGGGIAAGSWLGSAFAVLNVVTFSAFVVILRYTRARNMIPLIAVGALVTMAIALAVTGGDVAAPLHDIVLCLILGAGITGFGHVLYLKAARVLAAAEVTFLMLVESLLGPVWVWIFLDEVPRPSTLVGGAIVLATVGGWALARMREQARDGASTG